MTLLLLLLLSDFVLECVLRTYSKKIQQPVPPRLCLGGRSLLDTYLIEWVFFFFSFKPSFT